MLKAFQICLILIFIVSCGETEVEKNTRQEFSSIIRRIDANYQSLEDNKEQEESLSMLKARDFYSSYIEKFTEIRDDFAGAPRADKFQGIGSKIDSILTTSNKFLSNRQSLLISAFDATNAYSDYNEDLKELLNYASDYNRYSSKRTLNRRISSVVQDSIDFYKAYNNFETDINTRDSLVALLDNQASTLNELLIDDNFRDTLSFHKQVIGKENIFIDTWNNLENTTLSPMDDIKGRNTPTDLSSSTNASTTKNPTPPISIKGTICDNNITSDSGRNDLGWAKNFEWKKDDYQLICPSTEAKRGSITITYKAESTELPVEKGTLTFSDDDIQRYQFTILGERISVIVRLKKLFGEPTSRNDIQSFEELTWDMGNKKLNLLSMDNNSVLTIQHL